MKAPSIAVIVNSFNRVHLLKQCLKALERWVPDSQADVQVFIYDAGSSDGTMEWLEVEMTRSPLHILVIDGSGDSDRSFAAGLNSCVGTALEKIPAADFLLFYETDNQILLEEPVTQALVMLKNKPNLAACGFTVRRLDGSRAGAGMPFPKLTHFVLGKKLSHRFNLERVPYKWTEARGSRFSYVDVVFTSPLLVKPDAWRKSGGLDAEAFPFSDCDIDWARRLRGLGWRMGVVESDQVIHDNGQAISGWSKWRALHFHRARLLYFQRYHPVQTALVWPHFLALRHFFEKVSVTFLIRDEERKKALQELTSKLLRSVFNRYSDKH